MGLDEFIYHAIKDVIRGAGKAAAEVKGRYGRELVGYDRVEAGHLPRTTDDRISFDINIAYNEDGAGTEGAFTDERAKIFVVNESDEGKVYRDHNRERRSVLNKIAFSVPYLPCFDSPHNNFSSH